MANDTARRLLARVREMRQALGLSQEAFAERAGLKYKHYQSIEAGRKRDIRFSTLEKIADACGLELSVLLDFNRPTEALAEDRPKAGSEAAPGKRARKPSKNQPDGGR